MVSIISQQFCQCPCSDELSYCSSSRIAVLRLSLWQHSQHDAVDQLSVSAAGSRVKANSLNLTEWFTHVQSGSMLSIITNRYFYEKV